MVGIHATLLDGVFVGENRLVSAQALCTKGITLEPGSVYGGSAGCRVKALSDEAVLGRREGALHYVDKAVAAVSGCAWWRNGVLPSPKLNERARQLQSTLREGQPSERDVVGAAGAERELVVTGTGELVHVHGPRGHA